MINNINSNPQAPAFGTRFAKLSRKFEKNLTGPEELAIKKLSYLANQDENLCDASLKFIKLTTRINDCLGKRTIKTKENIQMTVTGGGITLKPVFPQAKRASLIRSTKENKDELFFNIYKKMYDDSIKAIKEAFHGKK